MNKKESEEIRSATEFYHKLLDIIAESGSYSGIVLDGNVLKSDFNQRVRDHLKDRSRYDLRQAVFSFGDVHYVIATLFACLTILSDGNVNTFEFSRHSENTTSKLLKEHFGRIGEIISSFGSFPIEDPGAIAAGYPEFFRFYVAAINSYIQVLERSKKYKQSKTLINRLGEDLFKALIRAVQLIKRIRSTGDLEMVDQRESLIFLNAVSTLLMKIGVAI